MLIKAGIASMYEMQEIYTLDEMLKLYALHTMTIDVENARYDEINKK